MLQGLLVPNSLVDEDFLSELDEWVSSLMATIDDACENISETESVTTCIVNLTTVASTLLSFLESNEPSSKLFDVVYKLHELLIPLSDEYSGASHFKNTIARVCESWWIHKWQGAEYLATQLLPHLLLASLEEGASSADVKRLYKVKEAFALLDFTDESIASIVDLLLRAMISPLYLKSAEGEKFLGYVLTLDSGCNVCPLIDAIKTQLAHCLRAKVATKYGAIIFRGWKDADDAGKLVMANEVQSLVYSGIHTQDAKYFQNIRLLMGELLEHKASKGVDAMLAELYDPILWRALSCANAAVRAQGSALFLDAFPLQNPSETGEQLEERLAMQFERMQSLLEDDDHRVRCVAATGVCRALGEYWEAFPLPVVKTLLLFLSTKLARDTASVHTRVATVAGLSDLIDNTASHRALLPLLKSVTFALHDKSDRVRLAFIGLLKRAHDIEGVHFYDIVPLEELLSRLVLDQGSPHCVLGLMQLLKASFYPSTDGDDQLNRCLSLIDADPAAAEVFYKELYRVASVGSATKMCVLLYSHMYDACVSDEDEKYETGSSLKNLKVLFSALSALEDQLLLEGNSASVDLLLKYLNNNTVARLLTAAVRSFSTEESALLLRVLAIAENISSWTRSISFDSEEIASSVKRLAVAKCDGEPEAVARLGMCSAYIEFSCCRGDHDALLGESLQVLHSHQGHSLDDDFADLEIASPEPTKKHSKQRGKRKIRKTPKSLISASNAADLLLAYSQSNLPMTRSHRKTSNLDVLSVTTALFGRLSDLSVGGAMCIPSLFSSAVALAIHKISPGDGDSYSDLLATAEWISDTMLPSLSAVEAMPATEVHALESPVPAHRKVRAKVGSASKHSTDNASLLSEVVKSVLQSFMNSVADFCICFDDFPPFTAMVADILHTVDRQYIDFEAASRLSLATLHRRYPCWHTVLTAVISILSEAGVKERVVYLKKVLASSTNKKVFVSDVDRHIATLLMDNAVGAGLEEGREESLAALFEALQFDLALGHRIAVAIISLKTSCSVTIGDDILSELLSKLDYDTADADSALHVSLANGILVE